MQTPEDENYYLTHDFYHNENTNGTLIMDKDSNVGVGVAYNDYSNGKKPSTNLIIHGHTMRNGDMLALLICMRMKSMAEVIILSVSIPCMKRGSMSCLRFSTLRYITRVTMCLSITSFSKQIRKRSLMIGTTILN